PEKVPGRRADRICLGERGSLEPVPSWWTEDGTGSSFHLSMISRTNEKPFVRKNRFPLFGIMH
ncbi:hypothetical protein, partial [Mesorhizobium sp. M7A.F.Ca.CA.001.16.1.1]|uniref:hypothetical protein n=1 Tax=Mesorhizobium sp. M7A.F.Ca.CA.001.16.1.1 TaxID=2496683 RepID=UPI0019D46ED0